MVRRIATTLYDATPDGEPGNDDLGAMSSWYVWAAMGLYPETPGRGELVLGSPMFPHVTVSLADGHAIVLTAPGASPTAPYVHGIEAQGVLTGPGPCGAPDTDAPATYACPWLPASVTTSGAVLDIRLGPSPDAAWGARRTRRPRRFPRRDPGVCCMVLVARRVTPGRVTG